MNHSPTDADEALWGIVYVSTARSQMSADELEFLLVEAHRLNHANRITGVLLHSAGNFMQYMEGPRKAVLETFERIKRSRRHHDILALLDEAVACRSFTGWTMGLAGASQSELLALSTANWSTLVKTGRNVAGESDGMALLRQFWANNASG